MTVYPLKFRPIFKERIWGGQVLKTVFGKELPEGAKIGESWELADLPEDKSEIINGPLAGITIDKAIEELGAAITGRDDYKPPFPLLIKILDANDILSVQVHPDPDTCRRMGKGDPKTECWYIIDAAQDAVIYKGLKKGVTKEQFAQSIEDGNCEELLDKVQVKKGECHFLPAGTCHAIGPGLLIAEIQTPSDTTYRVFDWNRVDDSGKGRQLHIADALESIHFDPSGDDLFVKTAGRLIDSDVFKVDKGRQTAGGEVLLSPGKMKVVMFITGAGCITAEATENVCFKKGDTLLIPAAFEGVMQFESDTEHLTITV
ncbi:MAG TPA: class I mannose-6-phosphate isomerase [Planctomycetes bacterium]|nr:class I mannose-6-phosphate isomerase [Planctomycetota bacterium]HIJ71993.1 class I mannose-6-phosphate isomerase [Planctomycetota bacterium]